MTTNDEGLPAPAEQARRSETVMESTQKTRRDLQAVVAHIHRDVVHDEVNVSMLDIQEVVRSLKEAGATREEADDLLNGVAQEIEDSATELTAAANELRIETDAALDEVFPEGDDHDDSDAALNVDIDHDDIEGTVTKDEGGRRDPRRCRGAAGRRRG